MITHEAILHQIVRVI